MSLEARQELVSRLVFQAPTQKADLLNEELTQTALIALLLEVTSRWHLEITAVRSDHHDDSDLGPHCHAHGYAVDCWPIWAGRPGDYIPSSDPAFLSFLSFAAKQPHLEQIGLAGSAWSAATMAAAGATAFADDGADHIHLGSKD